MATDLIVVQYESIKLPSRMALFKVEFAKAGVNVCFVREIDLLHKTGEGERCDVLLSRPKMNILKLPQNVRKACLRSGKEKQW